MNEDIQALLAQYDLNDEMIQGNHDELLNNKIISAYDVKQDIWKWFTEKSGGYSLPWASWHESFKLTRGEMTIVSGYSGHGKSEFVNQIALNCVKQGSKAMISSFELSGGNLYGRLLKQSTGIKDPTYELLTKFVDHYDRKLFAYDLMGTANVDDVLKSSIKAQEIAGIDLFIFDNLMMLNSMVDDFAVQHDIVSKLLRFAKDKNVIVILVAHSKKPMRGMPIPGMYDVSGSSNIINMVDNHLSVTKNLAKYRAIEKSKNNQILTEDEEAAMQLGDAIINRDKKREVGCTFMKSLHFNDRFNIFTEYQNEPIKAHL